MLKKNLDALLEVNEAMHTWINENEEPATWYEIIKNNMLYIEGKKRTALYDMDDPVEGTKEKLKDFKFHDSDVTVIIGCGLGFTLDRILRECEEKHKIIVIEHNRNLLKHLLGTADLSKEILTRKVIFIPAERDWVIELISSIEGLVVVEDWHLMVENYTQKRMEYLETINLVLELINQFKCNTGTVISAGEQIADNDVLTMPYLIKHRGISEIKDLYKGKPAILVSTGPSLSKNIHIIKEFQDKAVIIAVGQALRILLAYDIRPDFICTVDFGEVNMGHFKGLMDSDVPLIALNRTYAPLLKQYQGPLFVVSTPQMEYEGKAVNVMSEKGSLQQGGSVAHLCLSAAEHLGCDPIIITGQDLAVGTESHCKQADASGKVTINKATGLIDWKVKDPRCKLNNETYSMGPVMHVPGYYGGLVITNIGLASFITAFESLIRSYEDRITVYNATEGGADIPKTKKHTLHYCTDKYCKDIIDKTVIEPYLSFADDGDELIEKAIPLLKEDIDNMIQIIKWSEKALNTLTKLNRSLNKKKKLRDNKWMKYFQGLLDKNETYTKKAQLYSKKVPLVNLAIFGATRAIQTRELMKGIVGNIEEFKKSDKNVRIRTKRSRHILTAAKKSAIKLKKSTEKTYNRFIKYMKDKDIRYLKPELKEEPLSLDDSKAFLDSGNFARPMLIAKKMLNPDHKDFNSNNYAMAQVILETTTIMRERNIMDAKKKMDVPASENEIKYNALIEKAQELGREEGKYDEALLLLKDAVEIFPDREFGLYGLACAYAFTNNFNEAEKAYKNLIKRNPDNLDYQFDLGRIMMNLDEDEKVFAGVKMMVDVMKQTEEYDGFLVIIGDLYVERKMYEEALSAYDTYLNKFPADYKVWIKKADVHEQLNQPEECEQAKLKVEELI